MKKTLESLLILIAGIIILWFGKGFLIPLVLGLFFGFFFMGVGEKVAHKFHVGKYKNIFSVVLLILSTILIGLTVTILGSYLGENWLDIKEALLSSYEGLIEYLEKFSFVSQTMLESIPVKLGESFSFTSFNSFIGSTLGGLLNTVLVLVYSILTILYRKQLGVMFEILLPKTKADTLTVIKETVYSYVKGLLILVIIIGCLYYIGLLFVQTPYALPIAGGAALMTLVPTVGTFVGGISLVIATGLLTGSLFKAFIVFGWFMVIQQIEEFYILPKVVGKKVQLNVLSSIVSIVFWGLLRGVAGVFLAIPIMGVVTNLLEKSKSKRHEVLSV